MSFQAFSTDNATLMTMLAEVSLESWMFSNQRLDITLLSDNDDDISLYAETDIVVSSKLNTEKHLNICHMEILKVSDFLTVKSGYYIPRDNFNDLMKYKHLSLFYGRSIGFEYCISFVGYSRLLTFPLKSLSELKFNIR
ncbi:hypothetical protein NU090_002108 [Salmonella enterica]|nr:hypothetical protein [Salmonella enterica]EDP9254509.1 hypothetical protein [Salmonella enterica subsp. enterica serovar Newmexico]EDX2438761.1 hypothetical protein [Salmonella enterica subsp. enterica serovar Koenigstuhl]EAX9077987.1 hypothetical protein [Salmonella enterica]EBR7332429.1 hypothetical protein [Salmonella enterica]